MGQETIAPKLRPIRRGRHLWIIFSAGWCGQYWQSSTANFAASPHLQCAKKNRSTPDHWARTQTPNKGQAAGRFGHAVGRRRVALHIQAVKKILHRHGQGRRQLQQPTGRDAIDAFFIFLNLLKCDAQPVAQILLSF